METFWDQFRIGGPRAGELPTNAEYDAALKQALEAGKFSAEEAADIATQAARHRAPSTDSGRMTPYAKYPVDLTKLSRSDLRQRISGNDMQPQTTATLEQLERSSWFTNCGSHDTHSATVLNSWPDAIEHCTSLAWQNLRIEAANRYREQLLKRSKERFVQWNEVVVALKKTTIPFVDDKVSKVVHENDLPKTFVHCVQWDILHVCVEAEYSDIQPPGFYAGNAYWYSSGHFPCGWARKRPKGNLIVY